MDDRGRGRGTKSAHVVVYGRTLGTILGQNRSIWLPNCYGRVAPKSNIKWWSYSKDLGKVSPYGVYDQAENTGWVSVGVSHDTAQFAAATLRQWWEQMGSLVYPKARQLLVTADGGGSNGSRSRLWKVALQKVADETGLEISVCHFPPGTSKWNKSEH